MTPEETVVAFLVTRFRASIRRGDLGFDEPLISSGFVDSFGMLELIAFLEDTFGVSIDPSQHELTEFETVNSISALVAKARQNR
jgi:acyl carrier protein